MTAAFALLAACAGPQRPVAVEPQGDGSLLLRASGAPGEAPQAVSRDLLETAARLTREQGRANFAVLTHYRETLGGSAGAPTIRVQTPIVRSKRRNRRSSGGSYVDIDLNSGAANAVERVVMIVAPFDGEAPPEALEIYSAAEILQD